MKYIDLIFAKYYPWYSYIDTVKSPKIWVAARAVCAACICAKSLPCNSCATLWTVACQAPLSMRFCRQKSWSGLPFPTPGDLPDPGTEPAPPALALEVYSLPLLHLLSPNTVIKLHRSIFVLLSCPDPKN